MKRMVVFLAAAALAGCASAGISDLDRPMVTSDCVELAAGPDGMMPAMLPAAGAGQGIGVALNLVLPRSDKDQNAWDDTIGFDVFYAMPVGGTDLRIGLGLLKYEAHQGTAEITSIPVSATFVFDLADKGPGKVYFLAGLGLYFNDESNMGNVKVDASLGSYAGAGYIFAPGGGRVSIFGEGKLLLMDAGVSNMGAVNEVLLDAVIFSAGMRVSF